MREVHPNIFLIKETGIIKALKPPVNIYIIGGGEDSLIYDAGYGDKKTIKYVLREIKKIEELYRGRNIKFKITRIIPSHAHPDHIAGLHLLRKYQDLKIILTKQTADMIKSKKDYSKSFDPDALEDLFLIRSRWGRIKSKILDLIWWIIYRKLYGIKFINDPDEVIGYNDDIIINNEIWKILYSPGHSIDHISLYNEKKGILFSGDNILKNITTWLGPPKSNIEEYIKTIEFLKELPNLKLILSAHGSPLRYPKKRLQNIISHREERTQQVLDLVKNQADSGITPKQIIHKLYPKGGKVIQEIARGWVCLTLKMLEQKDLIKQVQDKKAIRFFPTNKI